MKWKRNLLLEKGRIHYTAAEAVADFCRSLSAAWRKCRIVCHALRCGSQCSGNNWAKKQTKQHTHAQMKNNVMAALQSRLILFFPSTPLLSWPQAFKGCFPALKWPTFLHYAPPPPPFPLPWPVPKGSCAHGGLVSCRPLKKHGTDVQGPKTMLSSSKQTCTCTHLDGRGRITHART